MKMRVTWDIDVEVDDDDPDPHLTAAWQALGIQRNEFSIATCFTVTGPDCVTVDIDLEDEEQTP